MKKIILVLSILSVHVFAFAAVDNAKLVSLSKEIIKAKDVASARALIESAKDMYFDAQEYGKCADFLKSLTKQRKDLAPTVNYYIGMTRYTQLKYLEESQSWDEYFAKGNDYREEIVESLQKAVQSLGEEDPLSVYSRLILYRFHQDQNDTFAQDALDDLMNAARAYAAKSDDFNLINEVASQLYAYDEKSKARELYKLYVEEIAASDISDDELYRIAEGFYKEGNLDLSEAVFDGLIAKTQDINKLFGIANLFSFKQDGPCDPEYAEKIFKKIAELGGENAFDENLLYTRAFNLEKAKGYVGAKDAYLELLRLYPQTKYADIARFKAGIITTYVLRDISGGQGYFQEVVNKNSSDQLVISSLYQLGLLQQWQENLKAAEDYYNKLMILAKDKFKDSVELAKIRLNELRGGKPIEHNLKTFMDVALKDESGEYSMQKVGLICNPYLAKTKSSVDIKADSYLDETGCLQPELKYLWSGHIGSSTPNEDSSGFAATYPDPGTKEINLVVVSSGIVFGHSFDMVDVSG